MNLSKLCYVLLVVVHTSLVALATTEPVNAALRVVTDTNIVTVHAVASSQSSTATSTSAQVQKSPATAGTGTSSIIGDALAVAREADGDQAPPTTNAGIVLDSNLVAIVPSSDAVGAEAEASSPPSEALEPVIVSNELLTGHQDTSTPPRDPHVQFAIRAGREKSRGVNLGGWLVAEHWMTKDSEIWWGLSEQDASCGEYTAMTKTPRELAMQRAQAHRDTFITESDIQQIAAAGLNTVRVPVGYWIVGFDNHDVSNKQQWQVYAPHGLDYLDRLIRDWAKKYNVAVLISMHAAKGSQNGADHSSPEVSGQSFWSMYPENVASTLDAVRFLAKRYKDDDAFLGIGLLNEPAGSTSIEELYKYYADAYRLIRLEDKNECVLAIAPLLWEQSPDHMTEVLAQATNVWVEWHRYFVWGYEDASESDLLTKAIPQFRDDVERWKTKSDKKMFIGEFSFATSKSQFNDKTNMNRLREYTQAQMDVMESAVNGGWTFWTWRIDGDDATADELSRWSLRNMIQHKIFPAMRTWWLWRR